MNNEQNGKTCRYAQDKTRQGEAQYRLPHPLIHSMTDPPTDEKVLFRLKKAKARKIDQPVKLCVNLS